MYRVKVGLLKGISEERGVTITELIIVAALLSVVIGAIYGLLSTGYASYNVSEKQIDAQTNARLSMDKIVKELREAGEANNGAFAIVNANPRSITFYADVDDTYQGREKVRYFVPSDADPNAYELRRGVTSASGDPAVYQSADEEVKTVAKHIRNGSEAVFTYYGKDYEGTLNPLSFPVSLVEVTLVGISLFVDVNPGEVPEGFELKSQVQLRNLKTNLGG